MMQIVIDIDEDTYNGIYKAFDIANKYDCPKPTELSGRLMQAVYNGVPLPKGHGFIAICDSKYPMTAEVRQELKNTVFVGDEDCKYCFDMTEIIEADAESEGKEC